MSLRPPESSSPSPVKRAASALGESNAGVAYLLAAYIFLCDIPSSIEMRCAISVSAYSSTWGSGNTSELSDRKRIGLSAGLTLRKPGGVGMPGGSCGRAAEIAVCTSCAAASILRLKLNCRVTEVEPCELVELIESMPAMPENWRSSGVAMEAAIVSGLAPGKLALTLMVG